MHNTDDTYKTLSKATQSVLFKDRNSKFYSYAFPVTNEDEVKTQLETLKKEHHNARHWCYAYQIGTEKTTYRVNDDGEPNNSAGMPIYGQIQSFELTNVLVVVVRYFGGTKLGVSGLINAYKTAAQMALNAAKIVERTINTHFLVKFDYKNMSKVMRVLRENNVEIISQDLEMRCLLEISVRKSNSSYLFGKLNAIYEVEVTEKNNI